MVDRRLPAPCLTVRFRESYVARLEGGFGRTETVSCTVCSQPEHIISHAANGHLRAVSGLGLFARGAYAGIPRPSFGETPVCSSRRLPRAKRSIAFPVAR